MLTSQAKARAFVPISAAIRSIAPLLRAASTRFAPEVANSRAAASPIPLVAPVIDAEARAARDTIRVTKQSEAAKIASEHRADGDMAEAKAAEYRYGVDAEGNRKLNEAENLRTEESRRSAILEGVVTRLPEIIREQVKPMENIESIKILQVDGLPGLNSPSEGGGKGGGGERDNISDQVVNSAMKYRTQVAFVDGLMEEIGLPLKNLGAAGGMQFKNFPPKPGSDSDSDD